MLRSLRSTPRGLRRCRHVASSTVWTSRLEEITAVPRYPAPSFPSHTSVFCQYTLSLHDALPIEERRVGKECSRWFEFQIKAVDTSQPRSEMEAEIVHRGERRPFFGFNRARHAVIEAAILATRVHLLTATEVESQYSVLESAVAKTGGPAEHAAFARLQDYVQSHYGAER